LKPKQVDVQTDIGIYYYLEDPPQYEKALPNTAIAADRSGARPNTRNIRAHDNDGPAGRAEDHWRNLKKAGQIKSSGSEISCCASLHF